MHNTTSRRLTARCPKADHIARLSEEFLASCQERRDEIGREIAAIIDGKIIAFPFGHENFQSNI